MMNGARPIRRNAVRRATSVLGQRSRDSGVEDDTQPTDDTQTRESPPGPDPLAGLKSPAMIGGIALVLLAWMVLVVILLIAWRLAGG
jgi:hypothetical protein